MFDSKRLCEKISVLYDAEVAKKLPKNRNICQQIRVKHHTSINNNNLYLFLTIPLF